MPGAKAPGVAPSVSASPEGGAVRSGSGAMVAASVIVRDWPQNEQKRGRSPENSSVLVHEGQGSCMDGRWLRSGLEHSKRIALDALGAMPTHCGRHPEQPG